jgi:hypothetical protein
MKEVDGKPDRMRTEQFKNASTSMACDIFELFQVQDFCENIRKPGT